MGTALFNELRVFYYNRQKTWRMGDVTILGN